MGTYDTQTTTGLPEQIKSGVESLSGYSMDDVKVHYNSSKPAQMKALAYTQGTDIHVAPGQEQHLGHEAWHVVQQKQGRVAPTTQLKGININTDSSLEHEADVMGAKAASWTPASSGAVVQQKSAVSQSDAPMQFWGLDEHEEITMEGANLSGQEYSYEERKALQIGAILNDVYENSGIREQEHSKKRGMFNKKISYKEQAKFGAKFATHTDAYINETHHGGMQFLHTMSNDEDAKHNYDKQVAWAKFCLDVQAGLVHPDDSLYDYVKSKGPQDVLFHMLMPMMVSVKKYGHPSSVPSKYVNSQNEEMKLSAAERALVAYHCAEGTVQAWEKPVLKGCSYKPSPYKSKTVKEFFGDAALADDSVKDNYGFIAIGTMLHMLEDSFAGSHSIRSTNLNQGFFASVNDAKMQTITEAEITSRLTRIMIHANYNMQKSSLHGESDNLSGGRIETTQGAAQAKVVVAYVLKKVKEMNTLSTHDEKQAKVNEIMNFLKVVLLPEGVEDPGLKDARGNAVEPDKASLPATALDAGVEMDDVEASGRAYDKMKWKKALPFSLKGKLSKYRKLLEQERGNHMIPIQNKLTGYEQQFKLLREILTDSKVQTLDNIKLHLRRHINEIKIDTASIYVQLQASLRPEGRDPRQSELFANTGLTVETTNQLITRTAQLSASIQSV